MADRLSLLWTLVLTVCTYSQVFQTQKVPDQCGEPYTMITVENSTLPLPNNTVFRLQRDGMTTDFEPQLFEKFSLNMAVRLSLLWTLILGFCTHSQVFQTMMAQDNECDQQYTMIKTVNNRSLPNNTVFSLRRTGLRIDFKLPSFEGFISCLQQRTGNKSCIVQAKIKNKGKVDDVVHFDFNATDMTSTDTEERNAQQGDYYKCEVPLHDDDYEESFCSQVDFSPCFTNPMSCIAINLKNSVQSTYVNVVWISGTNEDLTAYYDPNHVSIESCQSYSSSPPPTTETIETYKNATGELTSSGEDTDNGGVIAGVICALIVIAVLVAISVFIWRRKRKAAGSNSPDLTDTTYDRPQAAARISSINAYDTVDIGNAYSFQRKISDTPSNVYSLQRRSSEVSNNTYSLQQEANDTSNNAYTLQQEISDIPSNAYSLQKEVRDKRNNAYSLQQISDISSNNNVNENIESNNGEHKQNRKIRPRKNYDNVLSGELQDPGGKTSNNYCQNETATVNENQSQHEYSRLHENKRNIKNPYDQFLKPSEDLQESQSNPSPTNIITKSSTNQDSEDYSMALTIIDEKTNENAEDKNSLNCETNAATDEENQSSHGYSGLHENKRNITHPYDQLQKPNKDSQERQLNPDPTNITRESFSNDVSEDYSLATPFVDETSNENAEISII